VLLLRLSRVLNEEGGHRSIEHGEVDCHWNGATSLSLVTGAAGALVNIDAPSFLEHANVSLCIVIWLGSGAVASWGYRC
jgi:hypothetical protein